MTLKKYKRSCDGCTKCCEGWLHGNINGHFMGRGRKCFFVKEGGCSIYENRPDFPCKIFKCAWLMDQRIPEWFKPTMSNVVGQWISIPQCNIKYLEIHECENKLDSSVLSWLIDFYFKEKENILYTINGQIFYFGSQEFVKYMENR